MERWKTWRRLTEFVELRWAAGILASQSALLRMQGSRLCYTRVWRVVEGMNDETVDETADETVAGLQKLAATTISLSDSVVQRAGRRGGAVVSLTRH